MEDDLDSPRIEGVGCTMHSRRAWDILGYGRGGIGADLDPRG